MSNGKPMKPTHLQNSHDGKLQTSAPITKEEVTSKPSNLTHNMSLGPSTLPDDVTYGYSNNNKMSNPHNNVENEETTIIYEDYDKEAYGETTFYLFEEAFPSNELLPFDSNEDSPVVSSRIVGRYLDSLSSSNGQCFEAHVSSPS